MSINGSVHLLPSETGLAVLDGSLAAPIALGSSVAWLDAGPDWVVVTCATMIAAGQDLHVIDEVASILDPDQSRTLARWLSARNPSETLDRLSRSELIGDLIFDVHPSDAEDVSESRTRLIAELAELAARAASDGLFLMIMVQ